MKDFCMSKELTPEGINRLLPPILSDTRKHSKNEICKHFSYFAKNIHGLSLDFSGFFLDFSWTFSGIEKSDFIEIGWASPELDPAPREAESWEGNQKPST